MTSQKKSEAELINAVAVRGQEIHETKDAKQKEIIILPLLQLTLKKN